MDAFRRFILVLLPLFVAACLAMAHDPSVSTPQVGKSALRTFTGNSLKEIRFPIGGIGTGSVSLGGRGDLVDWEIFNRPEKGGGLDFSFFAIWAKQQGKQPVARVLERKIMPPFIGGGHGVPQRNLSGLPRFDEAEFKGEYPFANIRFSDRTVPGFATINLRSDNAPTSRCPSSTTYK